ncbi:MAG: diphthamide biosynthesis enzyme Dph2 [Candidatus Micrarchaeota archaeon]
MRILLQFPEGLKQMAMQYAEKYRKEGHEVVLAAAACYGACDLALDDARAIGADKIVHFGHARFMKKTPLPVEYVEWHDVVNLDRLATAVKKIQEKNIALATTVQHIHQLAKMKKIFEAAGKKVFIGSGAFTVYEGQVLGCDFGAAVNKAANAAVIVAGGDFHAVGAFVDYPVYAIHPKTGEVRNLSKEIERAKKLRKGAVLKAVDAKSFGVMVSTKPGQMRLQLAEQLAEKIRKHGRHAEVVVSNQLDANAINNFMFDALVNTACPRIADDTELFGKPVLNPDMLEELLKLWKKLG